MANNYFNFKQFTVFQDKCSFKVGTDGVLLGAYADITGASKILDIGTGSGLIALMLAQRSEAEITAIEPDGDSFLQASSNFQSSKWGKRIKAEKTDLQNFNPGGIKFNLIVSNPPYFSDALRNPDPRKAATRHNDSLTPEELLKGAIRLMADDGKLQVIMPYVEGNIFIAEASGYGLYCNNILKIKPLTTSEIRRLILTFSRKRLKATEKFLVIEQGERHDFTEDYKTLTKDFYLNF